MQIIPVIDLKDGCVVFAQRGNRSKYQPLKSQLCQSSCVYDVLDAFLNLFDFKTFYIADLNAICNSGNHQKIIDNISKKCPNIEFWVDNGMTLNDLKPATQTNYKVVIGSESQQQAVEIPNREYILSLDFKSDKLLGPSELFKNSRLWPEKIIIMTLSQVGSRNGPDFAKLGQYCLQYPQNKFIAAGGIRHIQDLNKLNNMGVKQALMASALHCGMLTSNDIKNIQTKKCPE